MSQFGEPVEGFSEDLAGVEKPTREEIERSKHHFARLAKAIDRAHSLGTREENHIGSQTFVGRGDKCLVVMALRLAAHGGN